MAYSAEIDVKVRNLGSISKLEEKLSSINRSVNAINRRRTAGASTSRSGRVDTTRAIREQLTGEKQITDEIIRRKNAFASLNKVKDGNDPVSKSIRRKGSWWYESIPIESRGRYVSEYHRPKDNWNPKKSSPYYLNIGAPSIRWRVTDPNAPVEILKPNHLLFTTPNSNNSLYAA